MTEKHISREEKKYLIAKSKMENRDEEADSPGSETATLTNFQPQVGIRKLTGII